MKTNNEKEKFEVKIEDFNISHIKIINNLVKFVSIILSLYFVISITQKSINDESYLILLISIFFSSVFWVNEIAKNKFMQTYFYSKYNKKENIKRYFKMYIEKYPNGLHFNQGNEEIQWLLANQENTSESFKKFLDTYFDGHYDKNAIKNSDPNILTIVGIFVCMIIAISTTIGGGVQLFNKNEQIVNEYNNSLTIKTDSLKKEYNHKIDSIKRKIEMIEHINENNVDDLPTLFKDWYNIKKELDELNESIINSKKNPKTKYNRQSNSWDFTQDYINLISDLENQRKEKNKQLYDLTKQVETYKSNIKAEIKTLNNEMLINIDKVKEDNTEKKSSETQKNNYVQIMYFLMGCFLELVIYYTNLTQIKFNYNNELSKLLEKAKYEEQKRINEEESDWQYAKKENIIRYFKMYIEKYPNGLYFKQANEEIQWLLANQENTSESFKKFLDTYFDGHYAKKAIENIANLELKEEENRLKEKEINEKIEAFKGISDMVDIMFKKHKKGDYFSLNKAIKLFPEIEKESIIDFINDCKEMGIIKGQKRGQKIVLSKNETLNLLKKHS